MGISDWSSDVGAADHVLRNRHAGPAPLEQRQAEALLDLPHLGRQSWFADAARLGRAAEAEEVGDGHDVLQLPDGRAAHRTRLSAAFRPSPGMGRRPTGARRTSRASPALGRSEEHTSELQSLMRNSYAVFCLKKKKLTLIYHTTHIQTVTRNTTTKEEP